ncbi:secreted protein [Candidatus Magnetomorum sp. HK-1]|nr:secreted protein [Candidatus Magnetomorum sp. HK-1]
MIKKIFFIGLLSLGLLISSAYAKEIVVKVEYESGNSCRGCAVKNSWNSKVVYTDNKGIAYVDVGNAYSRITIYVGGKAAACVRPGGTTTVIIKSTPLGYTPIYRDGC